jgi:hypothetical protein
MPLSDEQLRAIARAANRRHGESIGVYSGGVKALRAVEAAVRADMQREVQTVEELDALPASSVIHIQQGVTLERMSDGWYQACIETPYVARQFWLPAHVLFTPGGSHD